MSDSVIPWTATCQASLSVTNSWSLLKLMSIESVVPSNHLILCHSFLLLPSIFSSIRVFSSESVLSIRWPKDWSFSCSIQIKNSSVCAGSYGWVGCIVNRIASFLTHLLYPLSSQVLSCIINEDEYLSIIFQFLSSMSYSFSVQIFLPPWLNLFLNVLFFLVQFKWNYFLNFFFGYLTINV